MSPDDDKTGDDAPAEFLPASRKLQKKSGGPSGKFSKHKVDAAQSKIDQRAGAFMEQMRIELTKLRTAFRAVEEDHVANAESLAVIAATAREVKGMAGTFGFDLLTQIGDSLYEFAVDLKGLSEKRIKLIGSHIDAMELVIDKRITGDGGPEARELLAAMGIATDKLG